MDDGYTAQDYAELQQEEHTEEAASTNSWENYNYDLIFDLTYADQLPPDDEASTSGESQDSHWDAASESDEELAYPREQLEQELEDLQEQRAQHEAWLQIAKGASMAAMHQDSSMMTVISDAALEDLPERIREVDEQIEQKRQSLEDLD